MPSFHSNSDQALLELGRALRSSGYSFTTTTPATHARVNARPENALAQNVRDVFGWSRPFSPSILPPKLWELMQRAQIAVDGGEGTWKSALRFSSLGGECFFHSAFPTGEADSVFFGPDTYRFTHAIEAFFARNNRVVHRAVDVGCGAGPGAIEVAKHQPGATVFAVDINPAALRLTRINAALNETTVDARESNLLSAVEGDFDLIVANPPYLVDESKRAYRHGGGPLGAGLSLMIVDAALERLSPNGTLLLYTGAAMVDGSDPFKEAITQKLNARNVEWTYQETDPDIFGEELDCPAYARADRIAAVVLTATKTS